MTIKEEPSWCLILKFNEIYTYLNPQDLINLSLLNKQLRYKLKCLVLSSFNITNLQKIQALSHHISDTGIKTNLLLTTKFITNAVFNTQLGLQSFMLSSRYLQNLSTLTLSKMDIQLPVINELIVNLDNLRQLELIKVHIITEYSVVDYNKDLKLTTNLSHLALDSCTWICYDSDNTSSFVWSREGDHGPYLNLSTQTYPSLKSLKLIEMNARNHSLINNFLSNNSQLKTIEFKLNEIDPLTIDLIQKSPQINELAIWNSINVSNFMSNQLERCLCSIKSMKFYNILENTNFEGIANILELCPNVETLDLGYFTQFTGIYKSMLDNLTQLKALTFVNNTKVTDFSRFNELGSLSLDTVRLVNFNVKEINLNEFDNFRKLNRLALELTKKDRESVEFINNNLKRFGNWRVIEFLESINCYKV
ncbi:hypothetical protein CONCODRAFT_168232 [Conidiobolus coronatus NRRL 28638]|uniref:RNI-like protein n=1 Tax=Conidiobolus coronatus (strain ATCC 28846 / CBS 209.66 / NRRL 28638) TaxID=796925 RepID=A0A137NVE4_CONC2|nr:hypothetical protein CONCODRAFT_168232 [Conidiobolus coronatus NRRL 28638]|eukprot:KXN66611.1 hypothetical protein CONCODRAFT_168232 [Conidiobolus coronatus NRRL 28638]